MKLIIDHNWGPTIKSFLFSKPQQKRTVFWTDSSILMLPLGSPLPPLVKKKQCCSNSKTGQQSEDQTCFFLGTGFSKQCDWHGLKRFCRSSLNQQQCVGVSTYKSSAPFMAPVGTVHWNGWSFCQQDRWKPAWNLWLEASIFWLQQVSTTLFLAIPNKNISLRFDCFVFFHVFHRSKNIRFSRQAGTGAVPCSLPSAPPVRWASKAGRGMEMLWLAWKFWVRKTGVFFFLMRSWPMYKYV